MAAPVHTPSAQRLFGALTVAWTLLIVYATLFPFHDWRWPPGADLGDLLALPWPRWRDSFDIVANGLAYGPLGLFATLRLLDGRERTPALALLWAAASAALLSALLETLQQLLPQRVPSLMDVAANATGALAGGLLALLTTRLGWPQRLAEEWHRWLHGGIAGPLLVLLWPVALLFPTPVPLGLGQVLPALRELALDLLVDLDGVQALLVWVEQPASRLQPTPPFVALVAATSLIGVCAVAFACSRPGWRRGVLALGAMALAVAASSLSAALSFGPQHAWTWLSAGTGPGLAAGLMVALPLLQARSIVCAVVGLMALTAAATAVSLAPVDPYFAHNLQAWEAGRFIRFHGLVQWLSWLWPYAAMAWLFGRMRTGR